MIDVEVGRTPAGVRKFSVAYRLEFVRRWNACTQRGEKTRLLRQHNLTRATVDRWLAAHQRGEFTASMTAAAERSPRHMDNIDRAELAKLRKENQALRAKVAKSEAVIDILGKAYELLESINESSDQDAEQEIPLALMNANEYAQWLERHKLA